MDVLALVSSQAHHAQEVTRRHHDIRAGYILWLPRKDEIDAQLLGDAEIDDGCFNHPIVVLSTDQADGTATILIVSVYDPKVSDLPFEPQLTSKAYLFRWPRSCNKASASQA